MEEEEDVANLEKSVSKCITQAGTKKDMKEMKKLVIEANSFKDSISKKKTVIDELEKALERLDNDIIP